MSFKSSIKLVTLSIVASSVFLGCSNSNSNSDSTPNATVYTGTFIDAPVKGLKYSTSSQSGFTDENGEFKYQSGENVEFYLGNLSFGSVQAGDIVTPYTMGDSNTTNPSVKTKNIALLLQNFDVNRSNSNALDLSKLKDYNFSDINLSAPVASMESTITTLLATASFQSLIDENNNSMIDNTAVLANMNDFLTRFSHQLIDGKTFYAFIENGAAKLDVSFTTTSMTMKAVRVSDSSVMFEGSVDYTISPDGILKWESTADGSQQWNIVSINNKGIVVPAETTISNGINQNDTLTLYFKVADRDAALSAL